MFSGIFSVNKSLEEQNKHILESCHLEICEKAWEAFNENDEEAEDDVNGNGGDGDHVDEKPTGLADNPKRLEGAVGNQVEELGNNKPSRNEFDSSDGE